MTDVVKILWLIPVLPLFAAAVTAFLPKEQRGLSAALAIGSMVISFCVACAAFVVVVQSGHSSRATFDFTWLHCGEVSLKLGWVLGPLSACMAVMVTFVGP